MISPYLFDLDFKTSIVKDFNIKEILCGKNWYSNIRKSNQRAVYVIWDNNTTTVEPLFNLIDFVNKDIHEKLIPVLQNWKTCIKYKIYVGELCVLCSNKRKEDNFLCIHCEKTNSWLDCLIKEWNTKLLRKRKYSEFEKNFKKIDTMLMDICI